MPSFEYLTREHQLLRSQAGPEMVEDCRGKAAEGGEAAEGEEAVEGGEAATE